MAQTPIRAADFLNTLGANTHISYTDGGYDNLTNVAADLQYLGINQLRDAISDGTGGSAPLSSYVTLAQKGEHFTFFISTGSTAGLQDQLSLIEQLNTTVPGSVTAVEGPNEINNFPITYNGVSGIQGAIDLQQDIYTAVHANAALKGVSVDYFTGYNAGSVPVGPNPQTTSGLADFDTQHPYPTGGSAPLSAINRAQALGNESPPNGPAVYTETGYSTNSTTFGVSPDVQANYSLDLYMDAAQLGIAHTDLYQLMDAYQPGSPQGDDGYGLFDPNNAPKPAATGIHDLTTILADTGADASTFTPTAGVNFSVSGLPATGHDLSIQKSDGATDIVVWAEPPLWNQSDHTEVAAPTMNATVALGATYGVVKVFDPLAGTAAVQTLSNVSSVNLGLTDHPLIVEVEPQGSTPAPPNPPTPPTTTAHTLTLRVSEDAYQGDAQFVVKVEGQQVGGILTASALHSSGDSNVFSLTGNWASGQQTLGIQFLNDAWGGTPTTDRNLYVDSIAYDGTTESGTTASLHTASTASFKVGGATPAGTSPADTIVAHLSEDAYQGDAKFTLSIDGKQVTTPQSVTALHSAGALEDFSFSGNLGAGTHNIGITFTNDAYAGTPTTDRNLYVSGIDVNGHHLGAATQDLASTGDTATFSVTTTH
jgi:hypothetical protein